MWTVYRHTSPSGHVYIGITSRPVNERWQNGYGYSNQIFFNAILKYGWDNIKHEIIAENLTEDDAKQLEIKLIAEAKGNSYNVTTGGEGVRRPCPPETRAKIAAANTGHPGKRGPESHFYGKTGELNPFFGQYHSEETRRLLSELGKRYAGKGNPMYGKRHSEETRAKIAAKATGRRASSETRAKLSKMRTGEKHPMYGKRHSEETRAKISQSLSGKTMPNEQKLKISQSLSGTVLVNKNGINKRIKKFELETYINDGWVRGRIYKHIK